MYKYLPIILKYNKNLTNKMCKYSEKSLKIPKR